MQLNWRRTAMIRSFFLSHPMTAVITAYAFFCTLAAALFGYFEFSSSIGHPRIFPGLTDSLFARCYVILLILGVPLITFIHWCQQEQIRLATTDDITGLSNHRRLISALDREFACARRYHRELSVLMLDIDNFKSINDHYGHLAGDDVLREIGRFFKKSIRKVDVTGRYGGDEFLMILPQTSQGEAQSLASRLFRRVYSHPFRIDGERVRVSVSIGIASLQEEFDVSEPSDLIRKADSEMFKSKTGRAISGPEKKIVA